LLQPEVGFHRSYPTSRVCFLAPEIPLASPLKRGTLIEFSPHPSLSPLKGERSKD